MKKIRLVQPFIWSVVMLTVYSCKKETAITTNHPPIANAGPDTTIILSTNSFTLDGALSSDPDNNIDTYEWRKIAGPASSAITPG